MFPWLSWQTILLLALGGLGLLAVIFLEANVIEEPMLRSTLFKKPTTLMFYYGTIVHGMVVWSAVYYAVWLLSDYLFPSC